MLIESYCCGPFETNAYIIACKNTQEAAIIDPAPDSAKLIQAFINKNQLQPVKILLTHTHWDHIADVAALKKIYSLPVFVHEEDAGNLISPGSDGLPMFAEGAQPDHFYKEGDIVSVGNLRFQVIHTPGHSPGGVCLYEAGQGVLISGDTLFHKSIGNLSLPTAQPERMWLSLAKLAKLPPATKVYPGHGPDTTIATENWLPNAQKIFA